MTNERGPVVAGPLPSRYGAKECPHCGHPIAKGAYVIKVGTTGKTTSHGQGPGYWIHEKCPVK